jgi:hypothetical protein
LKALATSRSTVAVALGVPSGLTCGEAVRLADVEAIEGVALASGVAAKLDSVVVGGVVTSSLDTLGDGVNLVFSAAGLSGRTNCDDMMAGSTGAPLTVDCPVGARLAGGVYLLLLLEDVRGGKSCLQTPLYLFGC